MFVAMFWLGGLSWSVSANSDDIEKLAATDVKIARIEERQENLKEDVEDIADAQDAIQVTQATQTKILVEIATKLDRLEDKVDDD